MNSADGDVCCSPFDPSLWRDDKGNDYKIISWENKPFVKDGTYCCYYVPLNFGGAVTRSLDKINNSPGTEVPKEEFMILSDCKSPWYANVYLSVGSDKVNGATVEMISGDFLAKVFEGDYSNIGKWVNEVQKLVNEIRKPMESDQKSDVESKFYFYYPTCPKCAKKYGKNHVVILAAL